MSTDLLAYVKYGFGLSVGLLLMGFAFEAYHWHNYLQANPDVGTISSSGGWWFFSVLFVIGTIIAFAAFASGIQRAVQTDS